MSFVDKLKSVFRSKPPPNKTYTHAQLKIIAMKARIYLQQYYKKCIQLIQAEDSILILRKQMPQDCYKILQEIGRHVVEAQSIKIYCEILRKIQDKTAGIIKTNGDIALLKTQLNWFQSLLWYRKCKKIVGLQELHTFCFNFFKGVDVTSQITPKCEIFKIYPMILYLDPDCIIPLKKLYPEITQYIKANLDFKVLQEIFKINKQEIKRWVNQDQIQYQQRYISKSKSPIKIKKNTTPSKNSNNLYQLSNQNIQVMNKSGYVTPSNNQKNTIGDEKSYSSNQPKSQKDQNKQSSSFMRRLMQNSKLKEKKEIKIVCKECNIQFQAPITNINPQASFGQCSNELNVSVPTICQTCQKNKQKNFDQSEESFKFSNNTSGKTCQICGIVQNTNEISFSNNNLDELKEDGQKMNQNICYQCLQLLNHKKQKQTYDLAFNILQQNNSKNLQIEGDNQKKGQENQKQNQENQNEGIKQVQAINLDNQNYKIDPKIKFNKNFEDEEDSLKFIHESIVQKKKPIKKPYMVSIYCRAQFTDQSKRQS